MQDAQLADIAGSRAGLDARRLGGPVRPGPAARRHGYGHTADDVGKVRAAADLLAGYYHAVHEMTLDFVTSVTTDELARIVDQRWTPAVTASARLVSIVDDCAQHLGQAAYVRGIAG